MLKKVLISGVAITLVIGIATMIFGVFVNINISKENKNFNEYFNGVSLKKPIDIWNISQEGRYEFEGKSKKQTTYTDKIFVLDDGYDGTITNNGNQLLKVEFRLVDDTLNTMFYVPPGRTAPFSVASVIESEPLESEPLEIYVLFKGKYQNFSGYIK